MAQICIPARFNGPPGTGNGGYVAGLIAAHMRQAGVSGAVEVSLRAPPPLETALELVAVGEGCECRHGDAVVVTARAAEPLGPVPAAPSFEVAAQGRAQAPADVEIGGGRDGFEGLGGEFGGENGADVARLLLPKEIFQSQLTIAVALAFEEEYPRAD